MKIIAFGIDWKTAVPADVENLAVELPNGNRNTPLHFAARYSDVDVVETIIRPDVPRVDLEARNRLGHTPLHRAAINKNAHRAAEIMQILFDKGGDINARDFSRNTPLHLAVMRKNHSDNVVSTLLSLGGDFRVKNSKGKSALDIAKKNKHMEGTLVIYWLLDPYKNFYGEN